MTRKIAWAGIAMAAVLMAETIVRASGLVDFPVYDVGAEIGYLPKSKQSGAFLNKNDWYFNNKSMPVAADWSPALRPSILLIGNSIVMGGNPYRQQDKLAPQMQKRLGSGPTIWPIAAGGWTQINQIAYLDSHPEIVAGQNYTAWDYMQGGLSRANPWPGEYVFPSHKPNFATWYVLRRYFLPGIFPFFRGNELPPVGRPEGKNVQRFDKAVEGLVGQSGHTRKGIILLNPTASQLGSSRSGADWLPERDDVEAIANRHGFRLVDIAARPEWNNSFYLPDGVHPNVAGVSVLASILVEKFERDRVK